MRRLLNPLLENNSAVSYTISAIIITATTISLVLVASIYAYQVLEQQSGAAEFAVAKESILAFNDALENVAWKPGAVRSSRFTIEYGYLQLTPNGTYGNAIIVNATAGGSTTTLYTGKTGFVRYYLDSKYITFGGEYTNYILGSNDSLVVGSTDTYGRTVIQQQEGFVSVTLDYRVRAMKTSVIEVDGEDINYVDIWVIKLVTMDTVTHPWSYIHDFDLKARCLSVQTNSTETQVQSSNATISVQIGDASPSSADIPLVAGKVVFNVIVAEVQVSI